MIYVFIIVSPTRLFVYNYHINKNHLYSKLAHLHPFFFVNLSSFLRFYSIIHSIKMVIKNLSFKFFSKKGFYSFFHFFLIFSAALRTQLSFRGAPIFLLAPDFMHLKPLQRK